MKPAWISSDNALKGTVILPVTDEAPFLLAQGQELDKTLQGALSKALKNSPSFKGKIGSTLPICGIAHDAIDQIFLVGIEKPEALDEKKLQNIGGYTMAALLERKVSEAVLCLSDIEDVLDEEEEAIFTVLGAALRAYRFEHYKTAADAAIDPKWTISVHEPKEMQQKWTHMDAVIDGVTLARDLVTQPPNILYPESFVKQVTKAIEKTDIVAHVLDESQMKKLGMNGLLAVNQGSANKAFGLVLEYKGDKDNDGYPLALVGKGVTFDTGGYCLKSSAPSLGFTFGDMKFDMAGAAAVVGAMLALGKRQAKANVVGLVGLVENRIDNKAYLPSDVITTMSGKTVEIGNTDAEGRMVLADMMWYAQENYKPERLVDIATLSGATLYSVGDQFSGLFSEHDPLIVDLIDAGHACGEDTWHLPMSASTKESLKSPIADISNIGTSAAKSADSALFLQHFIQDGVEWAHLDMVGVAWFKAGNPLTPPGASGYGVRLFDRLVYNTQEMEDKA